MGKSKSVWLLCVCVPPLILFALDKLIPISLFLKINRIALAGVAQWIERRPANQRVTGSIPSQCTLPGLRVRSPFGGT